ncbi:MAG TPA: DUF1573 domain-containing protein [Chloroflexia bacterium]|nr:DUF1573 domain-containing protein [Chloroflexia bacterium]
MSSRKAPAGPKKPPPPAPRRGPARPAVPVRTVRPGRRDTFGLYFVLSSAIFIFLFGAAVWGLRTLNRNNAAAAATPSPPARSVVAPATATIETVTQLPLPPVSESPLPNYTPPAVPTLPAPQALQSGTFAPLAPITSIVTDVTRVQVPARFPAVIPQPRLDLSAPAVDLGTIQAGAVLTRALTLANPGARELIIRGLVSDCACLTARADASRLPTGTRTYLLLTYDSKTDQSPSGRAEHLLTLVTTDGQQPLTPLTVTVTLP